MLALYKINEIYKTQPWYTDESFKFIQISTDCTWVNFRTGETFNCWDGYMRRLNESETIEIIRELNLEKLGI